MDSESKRRRTVWEIVTSVENDESQEIDSE